MIIDVIFEPDASFDCSLNEDEQFACSLGESYMPDSYHGNVEVTPTTETQILATQGKVIKEDIVINPIPSNYGEIIWDGSTLLVK